MTAGFMLGERHRQTVRAASEQTPDPGPVSPPSSAPTVAPTGPLCPPQAQQTARETVPSAGDLYQIFKLETQNGTTVWICQDGAGDLYYQGKTGGLDAPLIQKKNGLFLPDVAETASGRYEVTAPNGNHLVVDKSELVIDHVTGGSETHKAVSD
jgi:hypothetical protein